MFGFHTFLFCFKTRGRHFNREDYQMTRSQLVQYNRWSRSVSDTAQGFSSCLFLNHGFHETLLSTLSAPDELLNQAQAAASLGISLEELVLRRLTLGIAEGGQ
jgi:hypothetical protein